MSTGIIEAMQTLTLTRSDGSTTEYVVEEERDDGALVIRQQTEVDRMLERQGARALTAEEFEELIAPHLAPPDGEG